MDTERIVGDGLAVMGALCSYYGGLHYCSHFIVLLEEVRMICAVKGCECRGTERECVHGAFLHLCQEHGAMFGEKLTNIRVGDYYAWAKATLKKQALTRIRRHWKELALDALGSILDHHKKEKDKLLARPYRLEDDDLMKLLTFCLELDLRFRIIGHTGWHEDTFTIVMWKGKGGA